MCIAILKKSKSPQYIWFAAIIRDELYNKSWAQAAAYWPEFPNAISYKDELSGGTWFAYNDHVVAMVVNREGRDDMLQSRGLIAPIAVGHAQCAVEAVNAMMHQNMEIYRPFNLLIFDRNHTFYLTNHAVDRCKQLESDLVLLNRTYPNDFDQIRVRCNFELIRNAPDPDPGNEDWSSWLELMENPLKVVSMEEETGLNLRAANWGSLNADFFACPADHSQKIIHFSHQLYVS